MKRLIPAAAAAALLVSNLSTSAPHPAKTAKPVKKSTGSYFDDPAFDAIGAAFHEFMFVTNKQGQSEWLDHLPSLRFSPATASKLIKQFGTDRLITATVLPGEPGVHNVALHVPAVQRLRPDGSTFSWEAMEGRLQFDPLLEEGACEGHAPALSFENQYGRLDMRNVSVSATSKGAGILGYGTTGGEAGNITFTGKPAQPVFSADGLFARMSLLDEGETMGVRWESGARALELFGERVDNVRFGMHLTSMDKQGMEAYTRSYLALSKEKLTPGQKQDVAPMMRLMGKALITQGAIFELDDIGFTYHGETATVRGELHLDNATEADLATAQQFMTRVAGHVDIVVPLSMVHTFADEMVRRAAAGRQLPAATLERARELRYETLLSNLVADNVARIEGERLVTSIDVRDGVVYVNGKPFKMPAPREPVAAVDSGSSRRAHARAGMADIA